MIVSNACRVEFIVVFCVDSPRRTSLTCAFTNENRCAKVLSTFDIFYCITEASLSTIDLYLQLSFRGTTAFGYESAFQLAT